MGFSGFKRSIFLMFGLCVSTSLYSQITNLDPSDIIMSAPIKVHEGDDPAWADPGWDDSQWESAGQKDFRKQKRGTRWYRLKIDIRSTPAYFAPLAIRLCNVPMACEIYWDGQPAGSNGVVGSSRETETPGRLDWTAGLDPAWTTPGSHVLAIRLSNRHHAVPWLLYDAFIGRMDSLQRIAQDQTNRILFFTGLYATVFILCLALFSGGWNTPAYLAFGAYAFVEIVEQLRQFCICQGFFSLQTYQWLELLSLYILTAAEGLLILFVLWHFALPRFRRPWLLFVAALTAFQFTSLWISPYRTLDFTFILILLAAMMRVLSRGCRKAPGRWLVFAGLTSKLLSIVYILLRYPDIRLFYMRLFKGVFLGSFVAAIALKIVREHRQLQRVCEQARSSESEAQKKLSKSGHLLYRENNENRLLPVEQILFFKAERISIEVHRTGGSAVWIEKPLHQLEAELPGHFLRIHRSYIVNLEHVSSFGHAGGSTYKVRLIQGQTLPVSRSRYNALQDALKH